MMFTAQSCLIISLWALHLLLHVFIIFSEPSVGSCLFLLAGGRQNGPSRCTVQLRAWTGKTFTTNIRFIILQFLMNFCKQLPTFTNKSFPQLAVCRH